MSDEENEDPRSKELDDKLEEALGLPGLDDGSPLPVEWTEEERERLRKLAREGDGDAIGVARKLVLGVLRRVRNAPKSGS